MADPINLKAICYIQALTYSRHAYNYKEEQSQYRHICETIIVFMFQTVFHGFVLIKSLWHSADQNITKFHFITHDSKIDLY